MKVPEVHPQADPVVRGVPCAEPYPELRRGRRSIEAAADVVPEDVVSETLTSASWFFATPTYRSKKPSAPAFACAAIRRRQKRIEWTLPWGFGYGHRSPPGSWSMAPL